MKKLILLAALFLVAFPAWAGITSAQAAVANYRFIGSPSTVAFGSNVTSGNLVEVQIWIEAPNRTVSSVVGSVGGAYAASMTLQTVGSYRFYRYYVVLAAGGAETVTVTFSSSTTSTVVISEWNTPPGWPANPVDAVSVTVSAASANAAATSMNTAQAEELIIGGPSGIANDRTITALTNYTLLYPSPDSSNMAKLIYRVTTASGAYVLGGTLSSSSTWYIDAVAYKNNAATATAVRHRVIIQ